MKKLIIRLNQIPDAYFEFVDSVRAYASKKESRLNAVTAFLDEHPTASTSDVLYFIVRQPDFFEDDAMYQDKAV